MADFLSFNGIGDRLLEVLSLFGIDSPLSFGIFLALLPLLPGIASCCCSRSKRPSTAGRHRSNPSASPYRSKIINFYEQHNPEKLDDPDFVDKKLRQYAGREDELFRRLKLRYGDVDTDDECEEQRKLFGAGTGRYGIDDDDVVAIKKQQRSHFTSGESPLQAKHCPAHQRLDEQCSGHR